MSDEPLRVHEVNCSIVDAHGRPLAVERDLKPEEILPALVDAEPPAPGLLERLVDHLETLPNTKALRPSDLLAILRPDTMAADADPAPAAEESPDA